MAEKKEDSVLTWLKKIKNLDGWILGLVIATFSTLGVFAVNNYSLPRDNARLEIIEKYMENDKTEKALMKENISNVRDNLKELKVDMKEGFKALSDKWMRIIV